MSSSYPAELELPALWRAADAESAASQKRFFRLKILELIGLAIGAASGLIPGSWAGGLGPAISIIAFLSVLILQVSRFGAKAESLWYDARAAAESIKSASWQYAVGGEAFRIDNRDAEILFINRLREVLANVPKLDIGPASRVSAGVTPVMASVRLMSQEDRAHVYRQLRIEDQVRWYAKKAAWNRTRGHIFTGITVTVEAAAILAGLVRFKFETDTDVLGLLAAVAAGLIAWSQAKKYAFLAESYTVTSHETNLVAATVKAPVPESQWSQSIHDAEAAFSREHTMWQARRQGAA
jgi:hypothetical protein